MLQTTNNSQYRALASPWRRASSDRTVSLRTAAYSLFSFRRPNEQHLKTQKPSNTAARPFLPTSAIAERRADPTGQNPGIPRLLVGTPTDAAIRQNHRLCERPLPVVSFYMRNLTWAIALLAGAGMMAVGCREPGGPRLSYQTFTYGEGYAPLPFAVGVLNDGNVPGHVDRVEAKILSVTPIPGRGLALPSPEEFKHQVHLFGHERAGDDAKPLPAGTAMVLPTDKTSEVWCALEWSLPDEAPPMLVVCSASFVLSYHGEPVVETPPQTVALQSQPGILENMTAAPVRSRKRAAKIVEMLSAVEGERSQGVRELVEHMEAAVR